MKPEILLRVIGYAVVPLIMAVLGNHLAAEAVKDKAKRRKWRAAFIVLGVVGVVLAWYIEWSADKSHTQEVSGLTNSIQVLQGTVQNLQSTIQTNQAASDKSIQQLKGEYLRLLSESQEKTEEARSKMAVGMSQEKVRVLQSNLELWGENFSTNRANFETHLNVIKQEMADAQREQEENKKKNEEAARIGKARALEGQVKYTSEVTGPFSFALLYLRGLIDSYANEVGRTVITNTLVGAAVKTNEIAFNIPPIPANIFTTPLKGSVRFSAKALWNLKIFDDGGQPCLQIDFTDSNGEASGTLKISVWRSDDGKNKPPVVDTFAVEYGAKIPVPNLSKMNDETPLAKYDNTVKEALEEVAIAQITQTESK